MTDLRAELIGQDQEEDSDNGRGGLMTSGNNGPADQCEIKF